jgi:hypothetical protein
MRGKNINTMSTRRAKRPDSQVYRQTRRLGRRRRSTSVNAAIIVGIILVIAVIVYWWIHRHS